MKEFGEFAENHPIAKYTLTALDIAAGPAIYAVRTFTPVGDLLEKATSVAAEFFAEGFANAGRTNEEAQAGGIGGVAMLSVGASGFAGAVKGLKNLISDFKFSRYDVRANPFGTELSKGNSIRTPNYASWGLTISQTKTVLSTAQAPYKGSTVLGHALSKHSGRSATFSNPNLSGVDVWGKVTGKSSSWNAQGMAHLEDIMRAPGQFKKVDNFLEKRLPDGRGVRLQMDKTFKGFID